jgi:hypothetical protein
MMLRVVVSPEIKVKVYTVYNSVYDTGTYTLDVTVINKHYQGLTQTTSATYFVSVPITSFVLKIDSGLQCQQYEECIIRLIGNYFTFFF